MVDRIVAFKKANDPQFLYLLLTYLCNTQSDSELLNSKGVEALFIHQNAFIDEQIYTIEHGAEKRYAAVHNANTSVTNFKRHHLAWGVKQIALITYAVEHIESVESIAGYKDLAYVNKDDTGKTKHIMGDQVAKILNASRCGIILSEAEGANYSSTEYILCGLPVVSTPSVGGRDEFFDPRHVKIVEPEATAVEKAVAEWGERAPFPEDIRASALQKSKMFRARLLHWLSALSGQDLFADANENLWSPLFIDKLRKWVTVDPYKIPEWDDPTAKQSKGLSKFLKMLRAQIGE
jgi:hypothetical protein